MAVVKADAYGHGLKEIAREAVSAGAACLGVATVEEGIELRVSGITAPIILLCSALPDEVPAIFHYDIVPTVGDVACLESLLAFHHSKSAVHPSPSLHMEIDTGMGRAGLLPDQAVAFWTRAIDGGLHVTGLTTHFADADGADDTLSRAQKQLFAATRVELENAGAVFEFIHQNNSAAVLRFPESCGNLVRPGLLLYGIRPRLPDAAVITCDVAPVLALKARVAAVRLLPAGHTISYGATYRLPGPARVATILIGYGDGYSRQLSNKGYMLLHGRKAPILGRVCMDQTVVDVTDILEVCAGDTAVCIGKQGDERITVEDLAFQINATEHEFTTSLTSRIPRVYLQP